MMSTVNTTDSSNYRQRFGGVLVNPLDTGMTRPYIRRFTLWLNRVVNTVLDSYLDNLRANQATLAQLVEHSIRNRKVVGSNPTGGSIKINKLDIEGLRIHHNILKHILIAL